MVPVFNRDNRSSSKHIVGVIYAPRTFRLLSAEEVGKSVLGIGRGREGEARIWTKSARALIAVPDSEEIKERMNRLKFRQFYRPVAPMIADEHLETRLIQPTSTRGEKHTRLTRTHNHSLSLRAKK